ncbi:MAG TPA: ABC transporter substrate-binding protein, partial [Thermoanaerobaculia bacterium]
AHAMRYGRDLDEALTDRFVAMYVNHRTLDFGEDGRRSVCQFLDEAFELGLIPRKAEPEFIGVPR